MDVELIEKKKTEIIEKYGKWTNHNIQLQDDIYTIGKDALWSGPGLRRITQTVADIAGKPLNQLRVLDLGCLEGIYAIELARHGAEVVGIEGREANIEKARFAKDVLGLDNLEFVLDDVRHLSREKYGEFDVVLCIGILYHLDTPDVFSFLESIGEVCRKFAIIGTNVSLAPRTCRVYKGKRFWGKEYFEHAASATAGEREKALWASLDNPKSYWFTRSSLLNLLPDMGFTSVFECLNPRAHKQPIDRITLAAIKGQEETLFSTPPTPRMTWPEKARFLAILIEMLRGLGGVLPGKLREIGRRLMR